MGNRAVSALVQRRRTLSRLKHKEVSSDALVRSLSNLPVVQLALMRIMPQGMTIEEYLKDVLKAYDTHSLTRTPTPRPAGAETRACASPRW